MHSQVKHHLAVVEITLTTTTVKADILTKQCPQTWVSIEFK